MSAFAPQANMAGGPPPDGAGGPPPELLALLAGGAGAGAAAQPDPNQGPDADAAMENLRGAIEQAQKAQQLEPDDQHSKQIAAAIKLMYDILAQIQKDHDQTLGNPTAARAIRRV
jgi:surface antigen